VAADTTEIDLDAQPPWDLIALLVLAFVVMGWMALALSFSPGPGDQGAFERLHSVALHAYRTLPWRTFLMELPTHYGPLFYALVGGLGLSLEGVRAAGLVMHWVTTLLMLQLALRLALAWQSAVLLASAFFVSVFPLGAALWGHPETLSMLLWMLGLSAPLWVPGAPRQAAAWLLPLTVGVDPAGSALVAASCLDDLRRRCWPTLAPKAGVAMVVLVGLHGVGGDFPVSALPQMRVGLIALAVLLLVLGDVPPATGRSPAWPGVRVRFLALWPIVAMLYALSPPLALDAAGNRLGLGREGLQALSLASPALVAAVLAWRWEALRADPLTGVQALVCAITLACGASGGASFDLRALDAFFWPLLLMVLIRRPDRRPALIRGALIWSAAGLLMQSLLGLSSPL